MLYTTAAVVALLPTLGVATRYLSGAGNVQMITPQDLEKWGGNLGTPNLAMTIFSDTSSNDDDLPASNQKFSEGESPQQNGNAGIAKGSNTCGFSNFVPLTEDYGYPQSSVEDCENLKASIDSDQEWIITQELQTIVENGTCAFKAVVSQGQGIGLIGALGNADVIDLVRDAIEQLGGDGYVGCHGGFGMYASAAGAMPCNSPTLKHGKKVLVDWFLTTPEGLEGGSDGSDGSTDDSTDDSTGHATGYSSPASYNGDNGNSDWLKTSAKTNQQQGSNAGGSKDSNDDDSNAGGSKDSNAGGSKDSNDDDSNDDDSNDDGSNGSRRRGRFAVRAARL